MQCVCDLLFWSRRDLENYLIQVRSEAQNHSVCINTSSGSFLSVIFPNLPLAPLLEFSGRLVGETLVRVLFFYFPPVLGGTLIVRNQNNGSIVFNSVF